MDNDEILIGEGVALSTASAPVSLRMLSGALDLVIYALVGGLTLVAVMNAAQWTLNDAGARALAIALVVTMFVLVPATVETFTRGLSLGHLAVGVRIVRDDGGPVSFRHAFTRALVGLVEVYATLGTAAVAFSLFSARGKRLGDMLAGTYAMRTRGAQKALPPVHMPPHLARWAHTADISRLPDGLALTCRMFLARADSLTPNSRSSIGTQISETLATHVSPLPPQGTHPEHFMAAVIAARRDREAALEQARMARADLEASRAEALPYGIPDSAR